jgi:hypothetical protein
MTTNAILRSEIASDPGSLNYAPLVAANDFAGLATLLNDKRFPTRVPTIVTDRTLKSQEGLGVVGGATVVFKLKQAAIAPQGATADAARASPIIIGDAVKRLLADGLDIGDAGAARRTRHAANRLGVLDRRRSIAAIKSLSMRNLSRLDQLGVTQPIGAFDVRTALRAPQWTAQVTGVTAKEMMLFPVVKFTNGVTGETFNRTYNAADITADRLSALIALHLDTLETRDAARETFGA